MPSQQPIRDAIMCHLRARGPSSFTSIEAYVTDRVDPSPPTHQIASTLNDLVRDGLAELYYTGLEWRTAKKR